MRTAFIEAITEAARRDERIMLLTADLGYKLFDDFAGRFPGRFLNMGVAEANMVSVAAGLALDGKRPFAYSIVPFATMRCLEQIRNDICGMALPVTITGVGAGYAYGRNGPTHHGVDDLAALRALPGMTVVSPADPREVRGAVEAIIALGGPAYLRLGRAGEPVLPGTDAEFRLGRATLLREGRDIALLACGGIAREALEAARLLEDEGLNPLVLSVHTVKPLCEIAAVLREREVRRVWAIEEHGPCGGLYEAVCAHLAGRMSEISVVGLCTSDKFRHVCGTRGALLEMEKLDPMSIRDAVVRSMAGET